MQTLTPRFTVELEVINRKHFYRVTTGGDTFVFPGVTGYLGIINKPALIPWAKREALSVVKSELRKGLSDDSQTIIDDAWLDKIFALGLKRPDQIKDDAADLGSLVHKYIDQIIQGKMPPDLTPEMEPAVTGFIEWWKNSQIELVMGDTKVASLIHSYGGSLDALGRQNGEYVILDWKTSNGVYDEYALQVAAYWQAFAETYGPACQRGYIVRFSKKLPVEFEVREVANLEESFRAFLHAKSLSRSMGIKHFL